MGVKPTASMLQPDFRWNHMFKKNFTAGTFTEEITDKLGNKDKSCWTEDKF